MTGNFPLLLEEIGETGSLKNISLVEEYVKWLRDNMDFITIDGQLTDIEYAVHPRNTWFGKSPSMADILSQLLDLNVTVKNPNDMRKKQLKSLQARIKNLRWPATLTVTDATKVVQNLKEADLKDAMKKISNILKRPRQHDMSNYNVLKILIDILKDSSRRREGEKLLSLYNERLILHQEMLNRGCMLCPLVQAWWKKVKEDDIDIEKLNSSSSLKILGIALAATAAAAYAGGILSSQPLDGLTNITSSNQTNVSQYAKITNSAENITASNYSGDNNTHKTKNNTQYKTTEDMFVRDENIFTPVKENSYISKIFSLMNYGTGQKNLPTSSDRAIVSPDYYSQEHDPSKLCEIKKDSEGNSYIVAKKEYRNTTGNKNPANFCHLEWECRRAYVRATDRTKFQEQSFLKIVRNEKGKSYQNIPDIDTGNCDRVLAI